MEALFKQAIERNAKHPCSSVSRGLGITCATQVVEYIKLTKVFEKVHRKQQQWIAEREKAKLWWEKQSAIWQKRAEEQEQKIKELQGWIAEQDYTRAWLKEQSTNWQKLAEEREQKIQELQDWIAEREKAIEWRKEQSANLKKQINEQDQIIQEQQSKQANIWIRLGSILGRLM